jgi:hypothetical protein
MSDIILVRQNKDLQLDNAIKIGTNQAEPIPGTLRYNSGEDRVEAYLAEEQPYNNSNWAPMSLGIASPTELGGIKIGNNLTITGTGVVSAVANASSRLFQRVISVCQRDNTGDYTSIQDCLNGPNGFFGYQYTGSPVINWTTSNGGLKQKHNTEPDNFPWPDASNLYIIQVSPGVYEENADTIRIPPYVVLQGDTEGSVVIRSNPTTSNVMIRTSTGSVIERITVDMSLASTANNTTGILCDYLSNGSQLRDITIATTDLSRPKTGISLVGTENIMITGASANIYLAMAQSPTSTNELVLVSSEGSIQNLVITDADFSITGNQNTKTAIRITNNTTARISGTRIAIQELNQDTTLPHLNTGITIQDSSADITDCQISVLGLDNKDDSGVNQLCQGIHVIDTVATPPSYTPMGAPTEFIHYNNFDDNDEIKNAAFDWQTDAGFKTGDYLYAVSPTVYINPANRGIFQIRGFAQGGSSNYTMQLDNSVSLEDQTFPSGNVSFCKLNNIGLFGCTITSGSQTIYVAPSGGEGTNFRIQSAYSTLDGQNPELGSANFILTIPQQITVGLQDCDFLSLADACDSIRDATAAKPYEIVMQPGLFIERRLVRIPSYVSVVGQGQGITILQFEKADLGDSLYDDLATGITNTAIVLGTDIQNYYAALSGMTINIPNGLNNKNVLDTEITGIRVVTIGGARLTDLTLNMGFSTSTPITTSAAIKGVNVNPTALVLAAKYYLQRVSVGLATSSQGLDIRGFSFTNCPYAALTDCRAHVSCIVTLANRLVYGIWSDRSKLDITNPNIELDIDGNAPGGGGYGIISTDKSFSPPGPSGSTIYSTTPVIIYGGQVRATGIVGDVLYSVFADYASTLFALNTAVQGSAVSRNDLLNTYPNSLLKTYNCYYFASDGTSFINVGDLDPAGNEMGGANENLNVGDPVGVAEMFGTKNVQVGIRTGTLNQAGNRNTMLGVDVGRQINTGNNNVLLGYAAGNNMVASNTTLVGAFCGQNIIGSASQEIVMMGTGTGAAATSVQESVVIGAKAANTATSISGSAVIGSRSAGSASALTDTIMLGSNTATGASASTRDILIGTNSVNLLGTSTDNLVIGTNAGQTTTTMTTSVLLGNETGKNRQNINESILIGYGAGVGNFATYLNNNGSRNVVLGHAAGSNLSTGSDNFIAGARAGSRLTTGSNNTILGSSQTNDNSAAGKLTTGSYNLVVGTNTANSLTTGNKNIVLGSESGNKLTTQSHTFILGYGSGNELTGSNSIIIGNESGKVVADGGALIIGHGSGTNAGGEDLLIIGHSCARGLTGARNTIIGNYGAGASGAVVLSGTDNVLMGPYAGYQLTTGSYNVLIGSGNQQNSTGHSLTSGSGNMIFGYQTAPQLSTGDHNLIMGKETAFNLASGSRNIFLGAEAAQALQSGSENVIIGNEAGKNMEDATGVVIIGNRAGYSSANHVLSDNLFIGNYAGYSITSGSRNTMIGNQVGRNETNGDENTYIGNFAGEYLDLAERNICVGYKAGKGIDPASSQNSHDNIIMGSFAGNLLTSGYQNILIGTKAGGTVGHRAKNIMIGSYVGAESDASYNIFIGGTTANPDTGATSVGYSATGEFNIVMGINAGLDLSTAERNLIMGFEAGQHVSTGSKNVIFGEAAGNRLTTGDNNILLGQNAGVSSDKTIGLQTGNNVIAIGTRAGGNIGDAVNDSILIGTEAGFKTQVDNAICIGPSAGAQNMTGVGGISIGYQAGLLSSAADGCISIGTNAAAAFTGSTADGQNIVIGDEAAANLQGIQNIVIGAEAVTESTNASNVIVIGYQAGYYIGGLPSEAGVNPDNSIIIGSLAATNGDIGADNILIGTKAGESIDNPRVFTRNVVLGAGAGRVSNLAVDSIILGQASLEGTGGVKNILMGSGAGAVLGNPAPVYPQTVLLDLTAGLQVIFIDMSYGQARLFFKEGDMILIESGNGEYSYQTQIGGIVNPAGIYGSEIDPISNSITIIVFTQPYPSNAPLIPFGASVRSLANLDTGNVGLVDESKASGNSLVGESAGGQITTGSKSVAFGTGALATNQIAKYNNAIGTEAAYNAISDNNTCLGTRAGYSIDLYDGLSYSSNAVSFSPNTNTITYSGIDGFVVDTNEFRFGTVFDIAGSTLNDGRYTVATANLSSITVNGIPKYEALGVPLNVSAEDLRVNSATFTFDQVNINGLASGGIAVAKDPFGLAGIPQSRIYSLAPGTWSALDNTNVFRITGSKYNDGVYYKSPDTSGSSNSYVIYGQFQPEVFSADVQITASSINTPDTITSGITFNDYQVDMPFYAFFGQNKGTYHIGDAIGTNQPTQSKYALARPLSNSALVSASSIIPSIAEDNIIFTTGYQQVNSITASVLPTTVYSPDYQAHYSFQKFQVFAQVDIYTANSVIYFDQSMIELVNAKIAGADIYLIDCPSADNDKLLVRFLTAPDNQTFTYEVIRGTDTAPVDESINASTGTPMYLTHATIKDLTRDVSGTFSNLGFVKLSSEYNMGLDVHTGDYLIDTVVGNTIVLAGNQVLPIMASNLGEVQVIPPLGMFDADIDGQVKTTIVREYLGTDPSYRFDAQVSGTDIMIQSGSFEPTQDPAFTYVIDDVANTITASGVNHIFYKLVAPCVVELDGNYLLVVANDYPFNTLKIDPAQDISGLTGITNLPITYNSISSHSGYTRFDSLVAGELYELLGGADNNRQIVVPVVGGITAQSAFVTSVYPLITSNTNKTVLGVYSPSAGVTDPDYQVTPRGYFKRMFQSDANLSITLNSSTGYYEPLKAYSGYTGNLSAVVGDRLVIQPSLNPDKYSLNNVGTNAAYEPMSSGLAYTFWDTANSDPFETITLPAGNTVTVYGEQFNTFQISPTGFLKFEGVVDIHTVNFQTTNDPAFQINSARVDSNVSVKYINDGNSTDGANNVIVINYATNNAGAASNWGKSSDNNMELRVYMDNTGNSAGRITLNYSDTTGTLKTDDGLDARTYVVLGPESTYNTVEKESRNEISLPISASIPGYELITCYQPSSAENGNVAVSLTANTYLYSQCTANATGSNPYYFTSSPSVAGSNFGAAVDIWGRQMIVGAPGDGTSVAGNAFIYSADGSEYKGYLYSTNIATAATAQFGYSVALWNNRAVVGAPNNTANGSVHIFDWNGSSWENTANLWSSIPTGRFGHAVDIYDSNTIVIGAPTTANTAAFPGSAHIFEFDGSNWIEAAYFNDLANDKISGSRFGNSVAIWGSNVIVGAPEAPHFTNSYDTGSITVYKKSSGIWNESQVIWGNWVGRTPAASLSTPYYNFGWSVDINNDYIIGGYPGYYNGITSNNGAVLTYTHSGGSWNFDNIILQGPTTNFGYDVSLNTNSLFVSENVSGNGKVTEYYSGGFWSQTSEVYQSGSGIEFGKSIASWNNSLAMGAPSITFGLSVNEGAVYVPKVDSLVLPLSYGATLTNSAATYDYGRSIAANSNSLAVGAPSISSAGTTPNGAVWIYRPSNNIISGWTEDASMPIQPDNLDAYSDASGFGYSVSLDADWLVTGAPYFNTAATTDSGRVYVYETDNYLSGSYARIDPPNPESSGLFGYSVAQDSGKLVIGAPGELSGQGNVYIYNYSAPNWVQDVASPVTLATDTRLGTIVKTKNNCIAVSARDYPTYLAGSVYVYKDGAWATTPDTLVSSDYMVSDQFGAALDISDRFVAVGAPAEDGSNGAVYIFERQGSEFGQFVSGTTYNETIKLTAQVPQGYGSTRFGSGVILGQDILVVCDGTGNSAMTNDNLFIYKYNPVFAKTNPSESWSLVQFYDSTQNIGAITISRSLALYGKELLVGWPEYSSSIGRVKSYNLDPLATAKYQLTRSTNTDAYYIPDWQTHTAVSGDLEYLQLGSNMINTHGQQSNTIAISKWGYLYSDKTQYVSLVEPLNGHYFDTAYWQVDNNIFTATLVDTTTTPNIIVQINLYTTASRYANNMEVTYLNLDQLVAGAGTFVGYSGLSHNLYNAVVGINNNGTSNIAQTANLATLVFNSPDAGVIANIALIENQDIIQVQGMANTENNGYFTVMSPVTNTGGGDYYMTIQHTSITPSVEEFEVLSANTTINEFRSYAVLSPMSNSDMDFQALRAGYGNTTNFLRFAKCYKTPMSNTVGTTVANVNVITSSLNYTVATWDNANVTSNVAVGLLETVPAEYNTTLSIPGELDKYLVALGTAVPNFGSNIILEQAHINTPPIGYIHNYMYRDLSNDPAHVQAPTYLFSSDINNMVLGGTGISGVITIAGDTITLSGLDSVSGGLIDLGLGRWDYGFKDLISKPFAGVKPGMLLRIYNNASGPSAFSANVMVRTITLGAGGELLEITRDSRLSDAGYGNKTWSFATGSVELTIQILNNDPFGLSSPDSCAQLISDRYNFAAIADPPPPVPPPVYTNYTGSYVAKLPLVNTIIENGMTNLSYMNNYAIPYNNRKYETAGITEDDTDIVKVLPYRVTEGTNNKWMIDDLGDRLWIVPRAKIVSENPYAAVLFFINEFWGSVDIVISSSGGMLTTTTPGVDFTVLQPGVIISIFNMSGADQYAQIVSIDSATQLSLNTSYNPNVPLIDGTYTNRSISVNIIGSYNTDSVNLAYFKPGQRIIVSKTDSPNDGIYYISLFAPTSPECIYIESIYGNITTAYPEFGVIERAMFGYEIYPIGFNGFDTTTAVPPSIYNTFEIPYDEGITSNTLATFKSGDQVEITSGSLNGIFTVPADIITQPYALPLDGLPDGITSPSDPTTMTKPIGFRVIGKAISTTTDAGIVKFHYTDAQGNNIMIGSFTGQYAGANGLSIHNLFLGNKVGQTNQGSGNIFFGSETGFATDASQGATAYDNKLAIYKNNFIGVPSDPLIGGDFASGRVGVGTIDPDGKLLGTLGERTLMVVDGKVRAEAYNTFTGTHFVILDIESEPVKPELGMILSSRGRVHKLGLLDNIVECQLSTKFQDKRAYGVYAGDELVNGRQIAHCAAVGEGSILVSTIGGEPENGDYLCSSPICGLAQLQPDDLLHNYTVAKLIEDVNWSAVSRYVSYAGQEYKVALVACSYHCA